MPILNTYDTVTLQGVIRDMDKYSTFLTQMFFPETYFFDDEEIAFDKIFEDNTLAPYVSPIVAGKVNTKSGYNTMKFKVPYVKDKDTVKPSDGMKRTAGEAFTGALSKAARIAAERVRLLIRHDKRLTMRIEEQASQFVKTGKILCVGEGHPAIEVDFQMPTANKITVTGAARWITLDPATDDGQDIIDDLEDWAANSNASIDVAVMEKSVWKHISKFKAIRELRDTQVRGEDSSFSTAPNTNNEAVQFKGTLGTLRCYVYTGYYRDKDGNKVEFLDAGRLILANSGVKGGVAFGAIEDVQVMRPMRMFSKNYIQEDPSVEVLLSQSAPLAAYPDSGAMVTIQTDGGA